MLSYSVRFSRRAVTWPGSGGAASSARSNSDAIQSTMAREAAASGRGRPGGGICPVLIFDITFCQVSGSASIDARLLKASRFTSAFFDRASWQE